MKVTLRQWRRFFYGFVLFFIIISCLSAALFPTSIELACVLCTLLFIILILQMYRPCPECKKRLAYFNQERCQHCGKEVDYDKEIFRIPTWREQWTKWKGQFKAWKEQVLKKEP